MQLPSLLVLLPLILGLASAAAINRKSLPPTTTTIQAQEEPSSHITTTITSIDNADKKREAEKMKARHIAAFKNKGRRDMKKRQVQSDGRDGGDTTEGVDSAAEGEGNGRGGNGNGNGGDTTEGEDSAAEGDSA